MPPIRSALATDQEISSPNKNLNCITIATDENMILDSLIILRQVTEGSYSEQRTELGFSARPTTKAEAI